MATRQARPMSPTPSVACDSDANPTPPMMRARTTRNSITGPPPLGPGASCSRLSSPIGMVLGIGEVEPRTPPGAVEGHRHEPDGVGAGREPVLAHSLLDLHGESPGG